MGKLKKGNEEVKQIVRAKHYTRPTIDWSDIFKPTWR